MHRFQDVHHAAVIQLVSPFDSAVVERGRRAGVDAFVRVDNSRLPSQVVTQVERVGKSHRQQVADLWTSRREALDSLSEDHRRVLGLLCGARLQRDIAAALGVHRTTVATMTRQLREALDVRTDEELCGAGAVLLRPDEWSDPAADVAVELSADDRAVVAFAEAGFTRAETVAGLARGRDAVAWSWTRLRDAFGVHHHARNSSGDGAVVARYRHGVADGRVSTSGPLPLTSEVRHALGAVSRTHLRQFVQDRVLFQPEAHRRKRASPEIRDEFRRSLAAFVKPLPNSSGKELRALERRARVLPFLLSGRDIAAIARDCGWGEHVISNDRVLLMRHVGADNPWELTSFANFADFESVRPGLRRRQQDASPPLSRNALILLRAVQAGHTARADLAKILDRSEKLVEYLITTVNRSLGTDHFEESLSSFERLERAHRIAPPPPSTAEVNAEMRALLRPAMGWFHAYRSGPGSAAAPPVEDIPADMLAALNQGLQRIDPAMGDVWRLVLLGREGTEIATILGRSRGDVAGCMDRLLDWFGRGTQAEIAAGVTHLSPRAVANLVGQVAAPEPALTAREAHAIAVARTGCTFLPDLASRLDISRAALDRALGSAYRKLGSRNLTGAIVRSGVLEVQSSDRREAPTGPVALPEIVAAVSSPRPTPVRADAHLATAQAR